MSLRSDSNTLGLTGWFFFSAHCHLLKDYNFSILNFKTKTPLFDMGMKIAVYDTLNNKWRKTGYKISYEKNNYV